MSEIGVRENSTNKGTLIIDSIRKYFQVSGCSGDKGFYSKGDVEIIELFDMKAILLNISPQFIHKTVQRSNVFLFDHQHQFGQFFVDSFYLRQGMRVQEYFAQQEIVFGKKPFSNSQMFSESGSGRFLTFHAGGKYHR